MDNISNKEIKMSDDTSNLGKHKSDIYMTSENDGI